MATATLQDSPQHTAVVEVTLPIRLPAPAARRLHPQDPARAVAVSATFMHDALLENNRIDISKKSKALDLLVVIFLHIALIGTPILLGLYFTDTINLKQFYTTFLVAPPPPPPPPPAPIASAVRATPPKRVFMNPGKLQAPTYIPQKVADIRETPAEPDAFGVEGGVPGGVPGGQMGGVIGGIISEAGKSAAPLPPGAGPRAPIRVGGRVRAPRAIYTPPPVYPVIAKQTRIQGTVVIDAVLDEKGEVVEAKVVSGHPMLIQAALDAVRDWRYQPTYLNSEPISVALIVNVQFVLQQ